MAEQQEEGLLEKIHALVAPPQSSSSAKQKGKKARAVPASTPSTQQKHGGIENNPFCNACGDGGSLLCCDNCPASFHFYCCDPPVDPKNLPSGEWLCRSCSSIAPAHSTPPLFRPLLEQATSANPLIFSIPEELKSTELLPGQSRRHHGQRSTKTEEKDSSVKLCYACNRRVQAAHLAQCDFCPLHFHLSCVDPPLTTPPTTAWMCPLHPHHSIPDFDHPRLSRRLRVLEKGREEVQYHNVKLNFLSKVNRVPHYKRVTRHLKRRVTEVPPALKLLYSDPMPEACETPPLSESLLCAAEVCQWWRGEEERRRRDIAALTSSSSSSLLPPSHHQDQWTRQTILNQVNQHSMDTSPPPSPSPSTYPSTSTSSPSPTPTTAHHHTSGHRDDDESAIFIAATQLLELSKRQILNGVIKSHNIHKPKKQRRHTVNTCTSLPHSNCRTDEHLMTGALPGGEHLTTGAHPGGEHLTTGALPGGEHLTTGTLPGGNQRHWMGTVRNMDHMSEEEECEREGEGEEVMGGKMNGYCEKGDEEEEMEGEVEGGSGESGDLVTGVGGGRVMDGGGEGLNSEVLQKEGTKMDLRKAVEVEEDIPYIPMCAPDLSLLDPRVVQLLASQRLQQLFGGKITGSSPSQPHPNKPVNGMRSLLSAVTTKPSLTTEALKTAQSILCPVSGIGTAFAVHKHITLIGTGSGVDVCLLKYGHCNYLSPRHACLFYNKVTGEYELLNYSDHGSVVDGVLYSCDFSDKAVTETAQPATPGQSVTTDKAREKVEAARRRLRDQTLARRALEGALNLSKNLGKDESGGEGTRRTTYNSSVVSIPLVLSRAKKLSAGVPADASPVKLTKTDSPEKTSSQPGTPHHSQTALSILCPDPPATPCQCRRSASCLVGTNRKGWEGTATLYHGSRLRFGCLQFVFSIAGRPGHTELVDSLSPLLHMTEPT